MKIHHILKDGTEVPDVAGYVVKADEFDALYAVIRSIEEHEEHEEDSAQC